MGTTGSGGRIEIRPGTSDRGLQLLAAVLVIGGAMGIVILGTLVSQVGVASESIPIVLLSLALFLASIGAGLSLWRGHPRGRQLATVLFALQIPSLSLAGLTFRFYTGASIRILVSLRGSVRGSADLGAFLNFAVGGDGPRLGLVGVNILAVAAVWYLLRAG